MSLHDFASFVWICYWKCHFVIALKNSPFLRFLASKLGEGQVLFLLMLLLTVVDPGTGMILYDSLLSVFRQNTADYHNIIG